MVLLGFEPMPVQVISPHSFLTPVESLIQILAFTSKEGEEFGENMEGGKQEPMTIGQGNRI